LDSIETKITQVTNAWQQFYLNIGLEDVWKGALTGITNILNTLNEVPKFFGKIPTVAIGIISNAISLIRGLVDHALTSFTTKIVEAGAMSGAQVGKAFGDNLVMEVDKATNEVKLKLR